MLENVVKVYNLGDIVLFTSVEQAYNLVCYGCFTCNTSSHTNSWYVLGLEFVSEAQGKAVIEMFLRDCVEDFDDCGVGPLSAVVSNRTVWSVVVGVCKKHLPNLEALRRSIAEDGTISKDMIAKARALRIL